MMVRFYDRINNNLNYQVSLLGLGIEKSIYRRQGDFYLRAPIWFTEVQFHLSLMVKGDVQRNSCKIRANFIPRNDVA